MPVRMPRCRTISVPCAVAAKAYILKSDAASIIRIISTGAVEPFSGMQPGNELEAA